MCGLHAACQTLCSVCAARCVLQCSELPVCDGQGWSLHGRDLSSAFPHDSFSHLGKVCRSLVCFLKVLVRR